MLPNATRFGLHKERVAVTPAQDAILRALNRYHFLTAQQLCRLRYSEGSLTYVQSLFKTLTDLGYCQRLWLPRTDQHGSSPSVYCLAIKGLNFLRSEGLDVPSRSRRSEQVRRSLYFLDHTLALNDFLIAAELLCCQLPDFELAGMLHERDLKQHPFDVQVDGAHHSVIPDAWLDLRVQKRFSLARVCLSVELDMGSESQSKWRRKVRSLLAFACGPYQTVFDTRCITFAVVTTAGEKRLADLLKWTEAELQLAGEAQNASLFLFAACRPAKVPPDDLFFRPCWYQPLSTNALALFDGAA